MAKNKEYTVFVQNTVYKMSEGVLKGVLDLARERVQNGVYAAKKANTIILLNEPNLSRERFRSLTKDYNRKGFVLLHNRGVSVG